MKRWMQEHWKAAVYILWGAWALVFIGAVCAELHLLVFLSLFLLVPIFFLIVDHSFCPRCGRAGRGRGGRCFYCGAWMD